MMSDNLTMLFPNASLCLFGGRLVARQLFTILSSLIVLPSVWLKDLSMLSYFSGTNFSNINQQVLFSNHIKKPKLKVIVEIHAI